MRLKKSVLATGNRGVLKTCPTSSVSENIFAKRFILEMFDGVLNTPLWYIFLFFAIPTTYKNGNAYFLEYARTTNISFLLLQSQIIAYSSLITVLIFFSHYFIFLSFLNLSFHVENQIITILKF